MLPSQNVLKYDINKSWIGLILWQSDPLCALTLRKIAIWLSKNCQKLDIFSKKIARNFHFFQKIANSNFVEKNENFWQFFAEKCQVFGNFLTVKWQFSGGAGHNQIELRIQWVFWHRKGVGQGCILSTHRFSIYTGQLISN